jgi:hypothetical protein
MEKPTRATTLMLGAVLSILLSTCASHGEFPVYSIKVRPSAQPQVDLDAIDGVLRSVGFQALPSDRNLGRQGYVPCQGSLEVLRSYRLTDAVGVYVNKMVLDNRLSVAMADTAKRGAPFSADDRALFSQLLEKLRATFGPDRIEESKNWGEAIIRCL